MSTPMKDYKSSIMTEYEYKTYLSEAIEQGLAEGEAKGLEKGLAEGKAEGKAEIAKAMKAEGLSVELISKVTELSAEQIKSL